MWGGEIRPTIARSKFPYPKATLTSISLRDNNYATGFTTSKGDQGVRFQGYKAAHLLFVLDEAPGIPPGLREEAAALASRTWAAGAQLIRRFNYFDAYEAIDSLPPKSGNTCRNESFAPHWASNRSW